MLIAGNWKMHKTSSETREFCAALRARLRTVEGVDVVVCPPYTSLHDALGMLAVTEIGVFAQNTHWEQEGAYTGEISPAMLHELGVGGTLVGHSECRQYFGESDTSTAQRARGAIDAGLDVIACVGETESEREAGETEAVLRRQIGAIASAVPEDDHDRLVIAYEPVWAIGTGKAATPELAEDGHALIKSLLDVPVLYGGSVNPDNAADLLAQPSVDGALVGGASLDVESFAAICEAAIRS